MASFSLPVPLMFTAACCLLLAACTSQPLPEEVPPAIGTSSAPELVTYTPFSAELLQAANENQTWNAAVVKISFDYDLAGQLTLSPDQEALGSDQPASSMACSDTGAPYNDYTAYFPYTGILVHGGELLTVTDQGLKLPLRPLQLEAGHLLYLEEDSEQRQFTFAPCVGAHQVAGGFRLDGYLPPAACLSLKTHEGQSIRLTLPDPTTPFILARYDEETVTATPMRPVLISIDLTRQHLTVQYQTTMPPTPLPMEINFCALLQSEGLQCDESVATLGETALRDHLSACPPPADSPIETCTYPNQALKL